MSLERLTISTPDVPHCNVVEPQTPGVDQVFLGLPFGYCGGVAMALSAMKLITERHAGDRVLLDHMPVHNPDAISDVLNSGAALVAGDAQVGPGDVVVYSAHGSDPRARREARDSGATTYDLTCPLVSKTHNEIRDAAAKRSAVLYLSFSKASHAEALAAAAEQKGIMVAGMYSIRDVCQTVTNRMRSAREMGSRCLDSIVVVGSVLSQNTREIAGVALSGSTNTHVYCVNSWSQLPVQLSGSVGVLSGASTPAENVLGVVARLNAKTPPQYVGVDTDRGREFRPMDSTLKRLMEDA